MSSSVTILDGGMGRELLRIGAPFRQPEWSALALLEGPERVVEAHTNFLDAGAEVITTNSYAVVPFHLGDERFTVRGRELAELSGTVELIYRDNGVGVPPALHNRIFEPLFTTRRGQGGTGLGLNIVYNLVTQKLAGQLDFWSAPQRGVTFRVRFALKQPWDAQDANGASADPVVQTTGAEAATNS